MAKKKNNPVVKKTAPKKTTTKKVAPKAEKPVVKKKEEKKEVKTSKPVRAVKAKVTPVKEVVVKPKPTKKPTPKPSKKSEPIKEYDFDLLRGEEKEVFIKRVKEVAGVNNVEKYMDDFRKSKEAAEFSTEMVVDESRMFVQTNLIKFIQKQLSK